MNNAKTSRRNFLKTSAFATAGALAFSRSSYASVIGANDRIRFGVIGCGGMGTGHLGGKLLERTDLNAVVIATPDHWHASSRRSNCATR